MNTSAQSQITNLWDGRHTFGDLPVDDAANFYTIGEIRSLPYVMSLNLELSRVIDRLRPHVEREPFQIYLPFPPMWKHQYEWLRRRSHQP
jgi:hypothetical protein